MTSILNIMVMASRKFLAKAKWTSWTHRLHTYVIQLPLPDPQLLSSSSNTPKGIGRLERFVELMRNDPEIIDSPSASDVQPLDGMSLPDVTFTIIIPEETKIPNRA